MSGVGQLEDGVEASTSGMMETTMMEGEEYYNPDDSGTWTQKEMAEDQLCRICAKPNQYLIPIFEGEGIEHQLEPKIQKHLPIEVSETDDLPLQVCYQCASTLIAWNDLVIACIEADKKLRQIHEQEEDDKGVEIFDEPILDSDDGEEPDQPSTSIGTIVTDIPSDTTVHPKRSPGKAKKPKLKMTLVKSPTAGPSGLKGPVKKPTATKPQDIAVQEASERCEDNLCEILHLHKSMQSSFEVLNDEGICPSIQDKVSHLQECLVNVTTGQMQTKKEVCGNIGETKFSCSLCKKITTDLVSHQDGRASKAFRTQFCSDCCASKPNTSLLEKPLADSDRFVSNLIEAYDEPLAMNTRNTSNPDNAHVNKKTLNSRALLYSCITCLMQNISVKGLSNHRQCMVMAQKKKINTTVTDHSYNKKKPRVMNYLLKQQETCIHIKCFMNSENQPEAYSCSLCHSDTQILMSEPCDHVKLLTDSALLDELVGNKSPKHRHILPSKQEPNIGKLLTDSVLLGELEGNKPPKLRHSLPSKQEPNIGNKPSKHRHSLPSKQEPNIGNSLVRKKTRYMCVSCGKLYSKQSSLVQHMQVHTVEPSPCPHCSKVFMSGAMLKAHLNVHDVFPYKCSQCSQTFLLEPLLKKHLSAEHNSKPRASDGLFKCNHCTKSFTLQSNLDIHLKSHDYSCTICGKNFVKRSALKSHNKCHSLKGVRARIPQVCDQCGMELCDLGALRKHQARQHGTASDNKNFVCETCGAAFWQKIELDLHQTIHSEDRPFTCDVCNATFKRKRYVASHFERVHSIFNDSLLDPCVTCGMKFNAKKHKLEHVKTHSNLPHICKVCNKSLSSKIGLYLHHKYAHERNNGSLSNNLALKSVVRKAKQNRREVVEGSLFSCNMCDKTYSTYGSLYQHRKNCHLNREYPCNVCGKVYTKAVSLYAHKHTHAKEGLACPICSKVFHWRGSFRQHLNTHSDVKKHHCEYCEKKFHRKCLLDIHTRTHTGEKPYACAVCGRSFAQTGDRNKHQMRHNRI